ncbi:MAG: hypothetical protein Kow00124_14310 [Anaerolineae bacterium]
MEVIMTAAIRRLPVLPMLAALALLITGCGGQEIAVGKPAPDFTLADARGQQVSLSDYAGQPVLLFFHMAMG